ncbi:MAG: alanine racemase [Oscillospiraceae bacterium]|nr:alanine racemase [Oscillospiraceae bacterium]
MQDYFRRTWTEIDLDAAVHNLDVARKAAGGAEVMCVVKADAYGHGVEQIALCHQRHGARWFGVSNYEEAMELRRYGITGDILIFGYTPPELARGLEASGVTQAVYSSQYAKELSAAADKAGITIKCHLKIDTGMGRIGLACRNESALPGAAGEAYGICRLPGLKFTGIFTHFAVADEGEDHHREFTKAQFGRFMDIVGALGGRGVTFRWRHCSNSGGTLEHPEFHLDMVRPGIMLYGLSPSSYMRGRHDLRPVMELKSVISMIKPLEKGASVSYGRTFTAPEDMTAATLPIGYADGFPRILSGRQDMLVRGVRAPVVGRVCMDQLVLDVSRVPGAAEGDVVTVFGRDGDNEIPVDELCDKTGTINYEMVCGMSRRVPRVYKKGGRVVTQTDYLL